MKQLVIFCLLVTSGTAQATPGALKSNGCHKNHCHSLSEAQQMSNGRYYIPGHFTGHRKKKRK